MTITGMGLNMGEGWPSNTSLEGSQTSPSPQTPTFEGLQRSSKKVSTFCLELSTASPVSKSQSKA